MVWLEAFLDGITGAGLFGKLRWPGAPTEMIDSRTVPEFIASLPEFDPQLPPEFRSRGVSRAALEGLGSLTQATATRPH